MSHTASPPRKWTARLELDGEIVAAAPCRWDTLAEVTRAAELEAAEYLRAGLAQEARVWLDKQLQGWEEPREDRQASYLWLEGGQVYRSRF